MAEKKPMKKVVIRPAINGWIVEIGCATVVALSKESMLAEIGRYIEDPAAVEAEYAASAVNQGTYDREVPLPSGGGPYGRRGPLQH